MRAVQGRLLIELKGKYDNIQTKDEQFGDSKMRGYVRSIAADVKDTCTKLGIKDGSMVRFGKYEDTASWNEGDKDFALIKLEEIGGVE